MKKIILIIVFLLPISIRSFVVKSKASFFTPEPKNQSIIVYLSDKNLSVDLEDYIIGVVAGEMPALFEEEALKAQAIAARSFALSKKGQGEIQISSTINDQVFLTKADMINKWASDYQKYYDKISACVNATASLVLKNEDIILKTYYFAMSNGYTEDAFTVFNELSFKSTESKWDNESLTNFIVTKEFTATDILNALKISETTLNIGEITRNSTNHVEKIIVNNIDFTGTHFRQALALRSTDFTIKAENGTYLITTKGYGHGVGMSQYGANGMAKEGYNYREILKHYYGDVIIAKI